MSIVLNQLPFHVLNDEEKLILGIKNACIGNFSFSFLYLINQDRMKLILVLQSFINSRVPDSYTPTQDMPTKTNFRWRSKCFLEKLGENACVDTFKLIQPLFYKRQTRTAQELKDLIGNPDIINNTDLQLKCANAYLAFIKEDKELARWLLPHIEKIFIKSPIELLFDTFSYNCFNLFSKNENVKEPSLLFSFTSDEAFEDFFQIPYIYSGDLINQVQTCIFFDKHYPELSGFANNRALVSLSNSSIITGIHFMDLLKRDFKNKYNKNRIRESLKSIDFYPELQPWFVLAMSNKFREKLSHSESSSFRYEFVGDSICINYINRIKNDVQLFSRIRQFSGILPSEYDFVCNSLPKLMIEFLKVLNFTPFYDIRENQHLFISDFDKIIDCDYICAYFAIALALKTYQCDELDINNILLQIPWYIEQISDQEKQSAIIIDIFSTLFLFHDGRYTGRGNILSELLNTLIVLCENLDINPYVLIAMKKVQIISYLNIPITLENALQSSEDHFANALSTKNYEIANYICLKNPIKYNQIFSLYKIVSEYKSCYPLTTEQVKKDRSVGIEISLSYDNNHDVLEYLQSTENNTEVAELLKKRSQYKQNPLFIASKELYDWIKIKLSCVNTYSWEQPSIVEDIENIPRFKGFMDYLDSFISASLSTDKNINIYNVLKIEPYKTLDTLIRTNSFDQAKIFAHQLKTDLKYFVFSNSTYDYHAYEYFSGSNIQMFYSAILNADLNPCLIDAKLFDEYKVLKRLANCNESNQNVNKIKQKIIKRTIGNNFKEKDLCFKSLEQFTEDNDLYYQYGIDVDTLLSLLKQHFLTEKLDVDLIADLGFRVPRKKFVEILRNNINNENFPDVLKIYELSLLDDTELIFIKSICPNPFPLEKTFLDLIANSEVAKAKQLMDKIHYIDFIPYLKSAVKKHFDNHKLMQLIINMFEVALNFIPNEERKYYDPKYKEFLASIPQDWDHHETPENIISQNLDEIDIVVDLVNKYTFIKADQIILKYMVDTFKDDIDSIHSFAQRFKSNEMLIKFEVSMIHVQINKLKIHDTEYELYAKDMFHKLKKIVPDELKPKFKCIEHFISLCLNARFGLNYHIMDIETPQFGEQFAELSLHYDNVWLFTEFCNVWNLDHTFYYSKYQLYQIQLLCVNTEEIYNMNEVLSILSHAMFFETNLIKKLRSKFPSIESVRDWILPKKPTLFKSKKPNDCHFVQRITKLISKPFTLKDDALEMIKLILQNNDCKYGIQFYCEQCHYKRALKLLSSIESEQAKVRYFIENIFKIAIETDNLAKLNQKLTHFDYKFALDYFNQLHDEAIVNECMNIQLEMELFLGRKDEAIETQIKIYCGGCSMKRNLELLDAALDEIAEELKDRRDYNNNSNHRISNHILKEYLTTVQRQKQFCQFLISKGLTNYYHLNLFNGNAKRKSMVMLYFKEQEFIQALDLMTYYGMDLIEMSQMVIDSIVLDKEANITSFLKEMSKQFPFSIFFEMIYHMLTRVVYVFRMHKLALSIILQSIDDDYFKCKLLIQFGQLESAASTAITNHFIDLLPMITNLCFQEGKISIANKCLKSIENTVH